MNEVNQENLKEAAVSHLDIFGELKNQELYIYRTEGVQLWTSSLKSNPTIISLLAGLWQSARAISKSLKTNSLSDILQFGNSSQGIITQSIYLDNKEYLISLSYKNTLNPAKLRLKFRMFCQKIEEQFFDEAKSPISESKKEEALFSNISDEEVDQLFTF